MHLPYISNFFKVKNDCNISQVHESLWLERPLAEPLGEFLAREVMFLRELRLEQLDVMLADLRQMTEVYLGVFRDKDSLTVSQVSEWEVLLMR